MTCILTSSSSPLLSAESENCACDTRRGFCEIGHLVDCVLGYIALFVRIGTDFSFIMKEYPLTSAGFRLTPRTRRNYISIICTQHISCQVILSKWPQKSSSKVYAHQARFAEVFGVTKVMFSECPISAFDKRSSVACARALWTALA
jgi:hypothetical protein